jgi:hypothetical protein
MRFRASEISDNSSYRDDERGSIEAGLTFIPTTAFFLLVLQLVLSSGIQVAEKISLQNVVTRSALGDSRSTELFAMEDRDIRTDSISLPGGGELLLVNSEVSSPRVSNFLAGNPRMKAEAIAIRE